METPDYWLTQGNPWEIRRPEVQFRVGFYGSVQDGKWAPGEEVRAGAAGGVGQGWVRLAAR